MLFYQNCGDVKIQRTNLPSLPGPAPTTVIAPAPEPLKQCTYKSKKLNTVENSTLPALLPRQYNSASYALPLRDKVVMTFDYTIGPSPYSADPLQLKKIHKIKLFTPGTALIKDLVLPAGQSASSWSNFYNAADNCQFHDFISDQVNYVYFTAVCTGQLINLYSINYDGQITKVLSANSTPGIQSNTDPVPGFDYSFGKLMLDDQKKLLAFSSIYTGTEIQITLKGLSGQNFTNYAPTMKISQDSGKTSAYPIGYFKDLNNDFYYLVQTITLTSATQATSEKFLYNTTTMQKIPLPAECTNIIKQNGFLSDRIFCTDLSLAPLTHKNIYSIPKNNTAVATQLEAKDLTYNWAYDFIIDHTNVIFTQSSDQLTRALKLMLSFDAGKTFKLVENASAFINQRQSIAFTTESRYFYVNEEPEVSGFTKASINEIVCE